jgi:hypothetical protein
MQKQTIAPTNWSLELTDKVLDELLECQTKEELETKAAEISGRDWFRHQADDGKRPDGDAVLRKIWGLAIRGTEYEGTHRKHRTGQPWTALDKIIIGLALTRETPMPKESKRFPTVKYIAKILRREIEEVRKKAFPEGLMGFSPSSKPKVD